MVEPKLANLYDYAQLVLNNSVNNVYENLRPIKDPIRMVDTTTLLGIEIEVENIKKDLPPCEFFWNVKDDNSLRNNGVEFTSTPIRAGQVEHAIMYYNELVKATNKPDYSNRTSVHVHLNVRDFTLDQLQCLVVLYCLFEKHFFHIAGARREQSIFCVPLYKTQPTGNITQLQYFLQNWHKYNALNLGTVIGGQGLPKYGTVEFRHLYGTGDVKIITNWINNILALKQEAMSWKLVDLLKVVRTLNTTSEYVQLYQHTFGDLVMLDKMEKYDFESCVSFVKAWEWGHELKNKYPVKNTSCYYKKYYKKPIFDDALFGLAPEKVKKEFIAKIEPKTYWNGIVLQNLTNKDVDIKNGTDGNIIVCCVNPTFNARYVPSLKHLQAEGLLQLFGFDDKNNRNLCYATTQDHTVICAKKSYFKELGYELTNEPPAPKLTTHWHTPTELDVNKTYGMLMDDVVKPTVTETVKPPTKKKKTPSKLVKTILTVTGL